MRRLIVGLSALLLCALVLWHPVAAQTSCVGTPIEALVWGDVGSNTVYGAPVPSGMAWVIRAAGVFTNDGGALEWMMEILHPVASQGNVCCWRIPIAKSFGRADSTPTLALGRTVVLTAGEYLAGRTNGLQAWAQFGIDYVGWQVPSACVGNGVGPW